ncbi:hypothetical protein IMSAG049_00039 [Clostridiales bacterium]|nr:hypothetical protein IMSAG049_00039 [Clostridiales bacterium]
MSVSGKIKALLSIKDKSHAELAEHLGISSQALSNKFYRDSFSSSDLIKIADFAGCPLAFMVDDALNISFDINDIGKH